MYVQLEKLLQLRELIQVVLTFTLFNTATKNVVVGIGYETAEDFAKRGAKVILACRDPRKAEEAVMKIINATGNNNVSFQHLDVSDFKSVRNFAESFKTFEDRYDIFYQVCQ